MKSKIAISILLAVLMLGTLATPAFAGKPAKGDLYLWAGGIGGGVIPGTETGSVSLQRTHDNYIKVSLVLKGATPGQQYYVRAANGAALWPDTGDSAIYANSRGVVRVKLTSTEPIMNTSIAIVVKEYPYDTEWDFGTYALSVPSN
jgi:hypothetical protein